MPNGNDPVLSEPELHPWDALHRLASRQLPRPPQFETFRRARREADLVPSMELRVYDCRKGSLTRELAKEFQTTTMRSINNVAGRTYLENQPGYINPNLFHIYTGDCRAQSNGYTSICINFRIEAWKVKQATMTTMENLRKRLVEKGHKATWSHGRRDISSEGIFWFTSTSDSSDKLSFHDAGTWARQLCEEHSHPICATWGHWQNDRGSEAVGTRKLLSVRFVNPNSVSVISTFCQTAAFSEIWKGYKVSFEIPSFIPINNAATIATTRIWKVQETTLRNELKTWIDAYMATPEGSGGGSAMHYLLEGGGKVLDKIFYVSCSTVELALYICSQIPKKGTPYELAYTLNNHQLRAKAFRQSKKATKSRNEWMTSEEYLLDRNERQYDSLLRQLEKTVKDNEKSLQNILSASMVNAVNNVEADFQSRIQLLDSELLMYRVRIQGLTDNIKTAEEERDVLTRLQEEGTLSDDQNVQLQIAIRHLARHQTSLEEVKRDESACQSKREVWVKRSGELRVEFDQLVAGVPYPTMEKIREVLATYNNPNLLA